MNVTYRYLRYVATYISQNTDTILPKFYELISAYLALTCYNYDKLNNSKESYPEFVKCEFFWAAPGFQFYRVLKSSMFGSRTFYTRFFSFL